MLFKILRDLVVETGKTQKEIASELGLSQQRFNAYVSGKRTPDPEMLCILASYFHVTSDYLLGRTEQKKEPAPDPGDRLDPLDERLMELLGYLTGDQKKMLLAQIETLLKSQQ